MSRWLRSTSPSCSSPRGGRAPRSARRWRWPTTCWRRCPSPISPRASWKPSAGRPQRGTAGRPATSSGRCGWRSPAASSRRPCSARWSCWAGSGRSPASRRRRLAWETDVVTPRRETRKMVTVLFIDAVSSTTRGEQMDPESLRAVLTRYFDVMGDAIGAHGGVVEKFIGDAVLAVFGEPTVHEDDALRACRAAIDINRRLAELEPAIRADLGVAFDWRMGINAGPVLAGEVVAGQRIVTGDAVNVAARLEA